MNVESGHDLNTSHIGSTGKQPEMHLPIYHVVLASSTRLLVVVPCAVESTHQGKNQ